MHALIVTSHPEPKSLTNSVAANIGEGFSKAGPAHTYEIADIAAEGFDPRFSEADLLAHRTRVASPQDVAAEQARIDRADTLVLVFPVYWWSMPGLLKGWIDRVFSNGWAYDDNFDGKLLKKLGHLQVHLVGIGGADDRTYEKHGYDNAMRTQIDHGIFDFCGASVATSRVLLNSDSQDPQIHLSEGYVIGNSIAAAHREFKETKAA
ncbi:NAD(P)H-dependent oxidoreductase [Phyllobacterium sp. YR531]|uniref:NAD(P)H-dependent oxidoreductase n=1 Tax=Phyllobacterium sp. YR531 TaxID=1144343 RepID=UPI00026FC368|nr:NAD(P)H-dependent oxidoreductase [Phyllobacterium sp. YR531]EJN04869.1 putative NADPH-quinone reductase (modulator of drug activity B) [Phyllobacterium sp. YR531]